MKSCVYGLAIMACLMLMATGCSEELKETREIIRPVRYQAVVSSNGSRVRIFSGTAKSGLESNLSFRVGGTVNLINVHVGDSVEKGHLIATLDSKDYRLQVQDAEAGLQQAKAKALNASSSYQRIRKLYENDNVSKSDLDNARAAFDSAKALVRSIEKKLELAMSQHSYTVLRAPFNGAVSAVMADENENIAPGHPVISLVSETKPEVVVAIPELLISRIIEGSDVTVLFDAIPGRQFEGSVSEVGVATTRFATTYPVTITLKNENTGILPGMIANVSFVFSSEKKGALYVPSHSVSEVKGERFVYVVRPVEGNLGKVQRVVVSTGELVSEGLEVTDGLSSQDLVITAGISRLEDGMKVRLLDKTPLERPVTQIDMKN